MPRERGGENFRSSHAIPFRTKGGMMLLLLLHGIHATSFFSSFHHLRLFLLPLFRSLISSSLLLFLLSSFYLLPFSQYLPPFVSAPSYLTIPSSILAIAFNLFLSSSHPFHLFFTPSSLKLNPLILSSHLLSLFAFLPSSPTLSSLLLYPSVSNPSALLLNLIFL